MQKIYMLSLLAITTSVAFAQEIKTITIKPNEPLAHVQPTMWGVFFEDINLGADGGIYAELIKNRSFEFFKPLMGWKVEQKPYKEGAVTVQNRQETNPANPRFLRVQLNNASKGSLNISNEGFRGMGIKHGLRYDFSMMYFTQAQGIKMHISLLNSNNEPIGGTTVAPAASSNNWQKHTASFVASATDPKARFLISFEGNGTIDLDMISLFPADTWKGRPGGLRADMVQLLADMKPGFLRFPGGCIVEGHDLAQRYQWKKTVGPIEEREMIINRWNFEFSHKPTPDYFQTFGLGFYEYFQLAEDMGAAPLPILNCGMACQFNTAELVPMDQLEPYIQDALDLVEFANGGTETKWGKLRAEMGHPASFHLKYLGVGNENWGPQYLERLDVFKKAILAKYPDIKIVGSSGTDPYGDRFDLLNKGMREMKVDIIDEHYYRRPEWFFANARRYDSYPRNESKILAGEFAAQSDRTVSVNNKNNWLTALSEAAFMTGLERNAGVVHMASYAPLFAHVDGWQWTPDLIWVDNLRSYGTPNYHVQKLFSLHKGTQVVPVTLNNDVVAGQDSLYATATIDASTKELIVKIVNASGMQVPVKLDLQGIKRTNQQAILALMQSDDTNKVNSLDEPLRVAPVISTIPVKGKSIPYTVPAYSLSVISIGYQ